MAYKEKSISAQHVVEEDSFDGGRVILTEGEICDENINSNC